MGNDERTVLEAQHAQLEKDLEQENNRPHPDPVVIAELKKQKLKIKDELAGHMVE